MALVDIGIRALIKKIVEKQSRAKSKDSANKIGYRSTITFAESRRPILVICAECICGSFIYILVNLTNSRMANVNSGQICKSG